MSRVREHALEMKCLHLATLASEQADRITELETIIAETENNFAIMQSGGDWRGIRVFGMTLDEVKTMMKQNAELRMLVRDLWLTLENVYCYDICTKNNDCDSKSNCYFEEKFRELLVVI